MSGVAVETDPFLVDGLHELLDAHADEGDGARYIDNVEHERLTFTLTGRGITYETLLRLEAAGYVERERDVIDLARELYANQRVLLTQVGRDATQPRKPSEALRLGKCPACLGGGDTLSVLRLAELAQERRVPIEEVPDEDGVVGCSACHGSGRWPPPGPASVIDGASGG